MRCQIELCFVDFDGSPTSARCPSEATWVVTYESAWTRNYVIAMGGWDAFRSYVAQDGDDPGEDPGEDRWGYTTEHVCDLHAHDLLVWLSNGGDAFDEVTYIGHSPIPTTNNVPVSNRADRTE